MANKIWLMRSFHSLFGRNVNQSYVNTFLFRGDAPIGDPRFAQLAQAASEKIAGIQHNQVQTLRQVVTEVRRKGEAPVPLGYHMTFYDARVGARALPANTSVGLRELVAVIGKNPEFGKAGRQQIRGCFLESDVGTNTDGTIALTAGFPQAPLQDFADDFPGVFTNLDFELVLPAPKDQPFVAGARTVVSMDFQGPGFLQTTFSRATVESAQQQLAKREVNALERSIAKARRNEDGTIAQLAGAILNVGIEVLQDIIARYGIALILRLALPPAVKIVFRALPALPG